MLLMHCVGVLCTFAWMGKGEFLSSIMSICVHLWICVDFDSCKQLMFRCVCHHFVAHIRIHHQVVLVIYMWNFLSKKKKMWNLALS